MSYYVGIDLGTTYSAIAYIDESGRPVVVPNDRGSTITASCVASIGGKLIVGEKARRHWANDPENAAARFKRDMGTTKEFQIAGDSYTPTQLSTLVLAELKRLFEDNIGPVAEAVVTIPANFSQEAREATMAAAQKAGLKIKFIINEPTAAALYYAYHSGDGLSGNYVVFDLGGGTFDVSVIKVNGNNVDVIASNGLQKLGGDDFDNELWKLVSKKFKEETGKELANEDFPLNDAEEEKKSLSSRKRTTADIDMELIDITRLEFQEAISTMVAQIEMMCEATMEEAGIATSDITEVFLAGGSTRMPFVIDICDRVFGKEPTATVNVDEIVALGAALYAAQKSDGSSLNELQKNSVKALQVSEVSNECFGTICVDMSESGRPELQNSVLIKKGTQIPCSVTKRYQTIKDGQVKINCQITESKSPETDPKFVKVICDEDLELPPNRPEGQEVDVTFSYDANQMIHAVFKDVQSGKTKDFSINRAGSNDSNDIDKFLVE